VTTSSPAPGVPQTAFKAEIAAGLAFLAVFLGALLVGWTDEDPLETRDFVVALLAALVGGGITGGATYQVSNKPK
jgi:hypothetical protein